jgi:WD40 repeat protein
MATSLWAAVANTVGLRGLLVLWAFASVNAIAADEPKRADAYGDPLPENVQARFGSARLRQAVVTHLAFAPGRKELASVGARGVNVRLWDASTGRHLRGWGDGNYLAFSSDGKRLAIVGRCLYLVDAATAEELQRLERPAGVELGPVAFSPDGHTVAVAELTGATHAVILWNADTGAEVGRLEGHTNFINAVSFAPDGKAVASGSDDQTIRLWDVASRKEIRCLDTQKSVERLAFSPRGNTLAATGGDFVVRLWDAGTGQQLQQIQPDDEKTWAFAFAPDGRTLATGPREGGMIRLWDLSTGKELRRWQALTQMVTCLAFSPDAKVLAAGGAWDYGIRLWDPGTGAQIKPAEGHTGAISQLFFARDGTTLYSSAMDKKAIEWDAASGRQRRLLYAGPATPAEATWQAFAPHWLSADAKILARTAGPKTEKLDPVIRLWDTVAGKELRNLVGHTAQVYWIRFSPGGKYAGSSGRDGTRLWEVESGRELRFFKDGKLPVFSRDSKFMALAGDDKTIRLCDAATGKEIRRWPSRLENVGVLAWAPGGKAVAASGGNPSVAHVWSTQTGQELRTFKAEGPIYELAFSPTGRTLVATCMANRAYAAGGPVITSTIHLWEAASGQEIRRIDAPPSWWSLLSLAFSPDGSALAVGGADSTILTWDLTHGAKKNLLDRPVLAGKELDKLWADLDSDANRADRAIWLLALAPRQSVPFLKERLRPASPVAADQVARLLADLDSSRYAVRQNAKEALDALGEGVEPALRRALDAKPTLEARRRIGQVLETRAKAMLRHVRAIEALEQSGDPSAGEIFAMLAKDSPSLQVKQRAAAAIEQAAK